MSDSISEAVRIFCEAVPVGYKHLSGLCDNPEELRMYLWRSGLLGDYGGPCSFCNKGNMRLVKKEGTFYWSCGARMCRKSISIRRGSFFERSHLEPGKILCLIYLWLYEMPYRVIREKLKLNNHTIVDWFKFCQGVCVDILMADNKVIGGQGRIVEIDETRFSKKRKSNKVCVNDGCWVVGGIDCVTHETFFQIIPDLSPETILPILIENILPDSVVLTDRWKAYNAASENIKHTLYFACPEEAESSAESQWSALKSSVLPKGASMKGLSFSYFSMYCVKKRYLSLVDVACPFKSFLELVKRAYPLEPLLNMPREDLLSSSNTEVKIKGSKNQQLEKLTSNTKVKSKGSKKRQIDELALNAAVKSKDSEKLQLQELSSTSAVKSKGSGKRRHKKLTSNTKVKSKGSKKLRLEELVEEPSMHPATASSSKV